MKYRPEIDGLRALAVAPVVLFHAGFTLFGGGFVGVDVFFVISGYLITSIILEEMAEGRFSLLRFYERRARRIVPALCVVVFACIPFAWLWLMPRDMDGFLESMLSVTFSVSNFYFWQESDYFNNTAAVEPLLHTWSLAVEEQFYFLFPILLLLLWKYGLGRIRALTLITLCLSLALAHWMAFAAPDAAFFLLPTRAWELAIGTLVAFQFHHKDMPTDRVACQLFSATGLLLISFAVFSFDETTPFPSLYALVPTVGAALIIVFANPTTFVGMLLGSRPFVLIGLVSYSAYLWHQPIFAFARYVNFDELDSATLLLLTAFAFILAYATWKFVELPFRNREWVTRRSLISFATATWAFFVAFCLAGYATDGFDAIRLTDRQLALLESISDSPKRNECHTLKELDRIPAESCEYHYDNAKWAVIGNSHAVEIAYQLAENLRPAREGVKHFTISSCAPSYGSEHAMTPVCAQWTQETIDYIVNQKRLSNVVLSYRMTLALPGFTQSASREREIEATQEEELDAYIHTVRTLVHAGKKVFLLLQAPLMKKRIEFYMRTADDGEFDFVSGVDRASWDRSIRNVRERLKELPKDAVVIDPAELFCDQRACAAIRDGKALYFDDNHMSLAGAEMVVEKMLLQAAPRYSALIR